MRTALQLPALISCSAKRHGMENGVSLMGGMRMMKSMFAVPQGSNRFSALSLKWYGSRALNNEKPLKYFQHCE